jgi:3-hydroxyacyl-[acyl-carrier-protein] dehydratase
MAAITTLVIAAEHPALAGHFPGAPIVPGVLLLDETVRAVESANALEPSRWRIGSAKFVKPVRPGETLTLEHEHLPNGSIGFSVSSAGRPVARGVLIPVPAQDRTGDAQQAG